MAVRPAFLVVCALCVCAIGAAGARANDFPALRGHVNDYARLMPADRAAALETRLSDYEARTRHQFALLTVTSLGGQDIEGYSIHVAEQWKLGSKAKDDGLILVVAKNERKMRIEVGYGLEGTLPDATAARIIRNVMTPRFREGDYDGGVAQGAAAIVAQLEGKPVRADDDSPQQAQKAEFIKAPDMALHEKVLFGAFIFGIIGLFTFIGIITPGIGWFLYFFLIPFWAMFPIAILGSGITFYVLIAYLVGFPLAKLLVSRSETYRKAAEEIKKKGYAKVGGFTVGGSGGSWSSSGSSWSSGGGFSGGGGSSGGGGASGSW